MWRLWPRSSVGCFIRKLSRHVSQIPGFLDNSWSALSLVVRSFVAFQDQEKGDCENGNAVAQGKSLIWVMEEVSSSSDLGEVFVRAMSDADTERTCALFGGQESRSVTGV